MTRGVRMPRDYRDPAASQCVSATGTAGGPVQGMWDLHRREQRSGGRDLPRKTSRGLFPCMFLRPVYKCIPSACRYSPDAEVIEVLRFTSAHMTFHGIMQNVSHFIRPNFMRECSLEAKTTFTAGNKFQSP